MTNVDDVYAELSHAKKMLQRRDYTAALEAICQAEKLWSAEVLYWRCEVEDANKAVEAALVAETSAREQSRVAGAQPEVRWQEANNQALGW